MENLIAAGGMDWPRFLTALVLVIIRLSGLMVFAPLFSSQAVPMRTKAVFLLALSVLLAPVVAALPLAHPQLGVLPILGELSVGMIFGFCLSMLNEVLSFAGQVLGFQFSFSLVNLLDPNSSVQTPLLSELFTLFGTLVLIAAGLDRVLLAALVRSFAAVPVGDALISSHTGLAMIGMASGIFTAALQLAAPVVAATVLIELAVALMGKLSPQLPVLALRVWPCCAAPVTVGAAITIGISAASMCARPSSPSLRASAALTFEPRPKATFRTTTLPTR